MYKNLDLTQDFPNKISFHFLWVKMLPKNLPKIFRWPEMCLLDKIAAIAEAAAAVTHVQSQSQEVGSGDEGLGLLSFDLSSAETDFWWLEDQQ